MAIENETKLNKLFKYWPRGAVFASAYLRSQDYSDSLLQHYKKQHWLESIGRGAYKLHNDSVNWLGGIYAIQKQLNLNIHVGAKTALSLQGYAHYVPVSGSVPRCHLFGFRGDQLPSWFINYHWQTKIVYTPTKLFSTKLSNSFVEYKHREFDVRLSCPERAALEMCYLIPKHQGFDEAEKIIENLATLRPQILQMLLEACHFIKVKRLFLYFADKAGHPWFKEIDLSNVDLGTGQRQIIKNGHFDNKYLITVPKEYEYENFNL